MSDDRTSDQRRHVMEQILLGKQTVEGGSHYGRIGLLQHMHLGPAYNQKTA